MSTLKVNVIQTNTGTGVDFNSPLETVPSLDVTGSVTVGGNITATGAVSGATSLNITGVSTFSSVGATSLNITGVSTFSSGIVVAAGTTAAPSISPTGDSNTGIFFPAADTIAFGEGGVEALRIDSSGNLGIGTNSPTKALHISQNSDVAIRMHSGNCNTNARSWEIVVGGNASNNAEMVFRTRNDAGTGGSEAARFTTSGNLAFPSGQGIDFSATANSSGTMTSELLSDYEEGIWTPTIRLEGGSGNGVTFSPISSIYKGRYVKIGDMVYLEAYTRYDFSTVGSYTFSSVTITGLPYTVGHQSNQQYGPVNITYLSSFYSGFPTTNNTFPSGYLVSGAATITLTSQTVNSNESVITNGVLSTNASAGIMFSAYYRTSNSG